MKKIDQEVYTAVKNWRHFNGKIEIIDGDNVWLERFDSAWLRR